MSIEKGKIPQTKANKSGHGYRGHICKEGKIIFPHVGINYQQMGKTKNNFMAGRR